MEEMNGMVGETTVSAQQEGENPVDNTPEDADEGISMDVIEAENRLPVNSAIVSQLRENPTVMRVGRELFQAVLDREAPIDFRVSEYVKEHPDFLSDCVKYGAKAAFAKARGNYEAEGAAAGRGQRALPKPTRPAYNQRYTGGIDYMAMSDEQFNKAQKSIHEAFLNGKKARI